jgi:predicted RNA-binding Zn-ribbon protein involved in translation (DUF1610 family)
MTVEIDGNTTTYTCPECGRTIVETVGEAE